MKPNEFTATFDISLADGTPTATQIKRWFNKHHCGQEFAPPDNVITPEHKEAHYALLRVRRC